MLPHTLEIDTPAQLTDGEAITKEQHLLVIDDEGPVREILQTYLAKQGGYVVSAARTAAEANQLLKIQSFNLILLDMVLEDADGLDLVAGFRKQHPHTHILIITGFGADDTLKSQAIARGAVDCISKGLPLNQLLDVVRHVLATYKPSIEKTLPLKTAPNSIGRNSESVVAGAASPKAKELTRLAKLAKAQAQSASSDSAASSTADGNGSLPGTTPIEKEEGPSTTAARIDWQQILDQIAAPADFQGLAFGIRLFAAFHPNLANTAVRSVILCEKISEILNLSPVERQNLLWAAAFHDLALVQIDRPVVNRWLRDPAKCGKPEIGAIKQHPGNSRKLLEFCPTLKESGLIIEAHHELWDGTGFPAGLRQESIPRLARILTPVIYYCSRHLPCEATLAEIRAQAGKMYDPQAVDALIKAVAQTPLPLGERELLSYELKNGMTLARDVANWDGLLIYGKETKLTESSLHRVVQLSESGAINPYILVYC